MSVLRTVLRPITSGVLKAILSPSQRYFTPLVASGSMHYTIPAVTLTGDFDIPFEFYTGDNSTFQMVLGNTATSNTFLSVVSGQALRLRDDVGGSFQTATGVFQLNRLVKGRCIRTASTVEFFIEDTSVGSGVVAGNVTFDLVGQYGGAGFGFNGILANIGIDDAGTLIRSYKINENLANGSTIIDSSGNGQNGTAINISESDLFTLQSNGDYLGVELITQAVWETPSSIGGEWAFASNQWTLTGSGALSALRLISSGSQPDVMRLSGNCVALSGDLAVNDGSANDITTIGKYTRDINQSVDGTQLFKRRAGNVNATLDKPSLKQLLEKA